MCLVMYNPFPIPGSVRDILCGTVIRMISMISILPLERVEEGFSSIMILLFSDRAPVTSRWSLGSDWMCAALCSVSIVGTKTVARGPSTSSPPCPFPCGLVDQTWEFSFEQSVIFTLRSSMMKSTLPENRECGRPQASHSTGWNGMQLFFIHFCLSTTF